MLSEWIVFGYILQFLVQFGLLNAPPIRDLHWSDVNFLHTTDTHGWYSGHLNQKQYGGDWGDFISFATHLCERATAENRDLLLIDSGDRHDGNGLSDITSPNGKESTPIFLKQDYDLLTIGNHELYAWENSQQEYEQIVATFPDNYVSTNVEYLRDGKYVPFGNKYRYFTTPNQKARILSLGFLFDFRRNTKGTKVTPIVDVIEEEWFQDILEAHPEKDVDILVIVTHVPISHKWPELYVLHRELRRHYPSTKIQYFGGHSHIRDYTVLDNQATALQSGRYCETVGWAGVNLNATGLRSTFTRAYIDFNRNSFLHHSQTNASSFKTEKGLSVTKLIHETRDKLQLNQVIGHVSTNYFVDYVPVTDPKNVFHLLTSRVLKSLKPEVNATEERIIIINTGSVRYDLYKGPYTIDSQYIVSPFENQWHRVTVPKKVALKVAPKLNENTYIMSENWQLAPPHHQKRKPNAIHPRVSTHADKLSKGYVTYDDFGRDGDDTPHRAVINHAVPNVVESQQVDLGTGGEIDLVFYEFIAPNVLEALKELGHPVTASEFYSGKYLGQLLNEYVANNHI